MDAFFEAVKKIPQNSQVYAYTVTEGPAAGEKALIADENPLFLSKDGGFLASHVEALRKIPETGVFEVDGAEVFADRLSRGKKMVICGAGHVSLPVIRLAKMIGMRVTVLDDRPEFAENARNEGADEILAGPFGDTLRKIQGSTDTFFVIVTRGHQFDRVCLREILKKPHAYIGMMGSRRRVVMAKQDMISEGFAPELVGSVHAPIGLEIGSETPEEIAVSILAEVIQVKNQKKTDAFPEDILEAILQEDSRRKVLATIIQRSGSAPREVGTRMLVYADGTIVGTIGGGLFEYRTIQRAAEMLREEKPKPQVFHSDLDASEAAREGEVCGGMLDVYLEEVGR